MAERVRDRFFAGFGKLGIRRPVLVALMVAILTLLGGIAASRLHISTSRFSLVAEDNYYQRRMIEFFDAFGYPDAPVAIVEGGTPEQRRETVDRLIEKLEQEDAFRGRTMARIDADAIAETLLVQQPGALAEFRTSLPPDTALEPALERGLEGLFGLIETQLLAALDGEVAVAAGKDPDAQLAQLAQLARALDAQLAADAGEGKPADTQALLRALAGPDSEGVLPSAAQLRERGLDEHGYLVSNDGERLLVAIFPEFAGDEVSDYAPAVERLRAIRDELELVDTQITFTGLPFLVVDEEAVLQRGLVDASVATVVGIFLLLLWAFRSFRRTIAALVPIGVGTIVSLGALYLLFDTLDPITSGFGAVLMGLGIDFAVHLLARYDEDLRRGWTRREAMRSALVKAGPGIVTGALTTALAFLTIATTEFTSYGEMGVITAIGLVVSLLVTLLILPVAFGRGNVDVGETPPRQLKLIELIPRFARKAPLVVLLLGLGLAFVGAVALPPYNPRYLDLLPEGFEASVGLEKLERDGAMTPWFAWVTADDLEQARERAESLRHQDSVGRVDSPTDLLPELTPERLAALQADFADAGPDPDWALLRARTPSAAALATKVGGVVDALDELAFAAEQAERDVTAIRDASKAFADLRQRLTTLPAATAEATLDRIENAMADVLARAWPTARAVAQRGHWVVEDLPDQFEHRFVARDGSERLALYVYPAEQIWDSDATNAGARRFTEQLEAIDPHAAGQGITLWYHNEMIMNGFRRASIYSVLLVVAFLLLDLGSVRKSLLALFPVLVGMGWMIGLFNVLDLRLNVATIVVIPLTLGIGVDAGVHMIHRWDRNARKHGGKAKLEQIIRGTGGAIVLSSLTTIVGFAGLLLGRHGGLVSLGGVMVVAIACTTLASVVMLPALLLVLDKAE
jgi:predicted RND superfamily exporter protein